MIKHIHLSHFYIEKLQKAVQVNAKMQFSISSLKHHVMHKVLQKMRDASTAVKSSAYLHRITMHEMQKREMQDSEMEKKKRKV